jgi:ABC-type multidrug transport system ATPase subunit
MQLRFDVINFLDALKENGIQTKDINIHQRSLEEIFVKLVEKK